MSTKRKAQQPAEKDGDKEKKAKTSSSDQDEKETAYFASLAAQYSPSSSSSSSDQKTVKEKNPLLGQEDLLFLQSRPNPVHSNQNFKKMTIDELHEYYSQLRKIVTKLGKSSKAIREREAALKKEEKETKKKKDLNKPVSEFSSKFPGEKVHISRVCKKCDGEGAIQCEPPYQTIMEECGPCKGRGYTGGNYNTYLSVDECRRSKKK